MKLREGFVSNSSTSSFIVAAADDEALKVKVTVEIDLAWYRHEEDGIILYSPAHLERYIDEEYDEVGWSGKTVREEEWYLQSKAALEAGKIVLMGEIAYDGGCGAGGAFERLVNRVGLREALVDNPNVEVIHYEKE